MGALLKLMVVTDHRQERDTARLERRHYRRTWKEGPWRRHGEEVPDAIVQTHSVCKAAGQKGVEWTTDVFLRKGKVSGSAEALVSSGPLPASSADTAVPQNQTLPICSTYVW